MPPADNTLVPVTEEPLNAETPLSALQEPVTPAPLVYVRNHFAIPSIDPAEWRLIVGGEVESSLSFSLEELKELPHRTVTMTLECAGNGRRAMSPKPPGTAWGFGAVSVARFAGTPLAGVLEAAGPRRRASEVLFRGADAGEVTPGRTVQYARSLPLDTALGSEPLLAWELNGEPLTQEHGFPVRLVVPDWYGMASVKWLEQIDVLKEPFDGFFQAEHYVYSEELGVADGAPVRRIRVRSLIASPGADATLAREPQTIRGLAWSGHGPIAKVEVSTDGGGNWEEALLEPQSSRHTAQSWSFRWTPTRAGAYRLVSRATDASGNGQPGGHRWNRLGYGNNGPHTVTVTVE